MVGEGLAIPRQPAECDRGAAFERRRAARVRDLRNHPAAAKVEQDAQMVAEIDQILDAPFEAVVAGREVTDRDPFGPDRQQAMLAGAQIAGHPRADGAAILQRHAATPGRGRSLH